MAVISGHWLFLTQAMDILEIMRILLYRHQLEAGKEGSQAGKSLSPINSKASADRSFSCLIL